MLGQTILMTTKNKQWFFSPLPSNMCLCTVKALLCTQSLCCLVSRILALFVRLSISMYIWKRIKILRLLCTDTISQSATVWSMRGLICAHAHIKRTVLGTRTQVSKKATLIEQTCDYVIILCCTSLIVALLQPYSDMRYLPCPRWKGSTAALCPCSEGWRSPG